MRNIKDIIVGLLDGKIVLACTECGWGLLCSVSASLALTGLIERLALVSTIGEEVILIDKGEVMLDYAQDIPEMAFTLLEISDKPLTITLDDWFAEAPLGSLFKDGLSFRVSGDELILDLIKKLRTNLLFIPLSLTRFDDIGPSLLSLADIVVPEDVMKNPSFIKPGIILFKKNGSFKVIRE